MINWGTVPAGAVLPFPFASYGKTNGESITLTGLAVTDVEIYKGTSMTQRASDAGVVLLDTDGIDIDGVTGIHGFSIDTGDNTDAGFYAVGSFFYVIVSAVTIDSQTVNFVAGTFRLAAAEAIAGKPKADVDAWLGTAAATPTTAGVPEVDVTHWLGTAAATPTVAGVPEVDVTHVAGSTTDVSTIPASVAAILVDTGTTLDGKVDTIAGYLDTEVAAILAAVDTEIATLLSDLAAVKNKTDSLTFTVASRVDAQVLGVQSAAANLKKNTAFSAFEFVMTDSTNHNPATGLTVTATRSIDGAAFGACANAVAEVASGVYKIDLAAADLNGNAITLRFTATGADDRLITVITQP